MLQATEIEYRVVLAAFGGVLALGRPRHVHVVDHASVLVRRGVDRIGDGAAQPLLHQRLEVARLARYDGQLGQRRKIAQPAVLLELPVFAENCKAPNRCFRPADSVEVADARVSQRWERLQSKGTAACMRGG